MNIIFGLLILLAIMLMFSQPAYKEIEKNLVECERHGTVVVDRYNQYTYCILKDRK